MSSMHLDLLYIINRYVHIVCTTLLVGGILFYELVVPIAINDLKHEQKLSVFGRARWSFRAIVWTCAIVLLISGVLSTVRLRQEYWGAPVQNAISREPEGKVVAIARRPMWWWAAHVAMGFVALVVAVSVMSVRTPPRNLLFLMRVTLIIVLVAIFFATVSRHMRLFNLESTHPGIAAGE